MKSDFASETFKRKFSKIIFLRNFNLIIIRSESNRENHLKKAFEQRKLKNPD